MITLEQIQTRLISAILESNISKQELADALNLPLSTIALYSSGYIMPALDTFANLCQILEVDVNYILCQDIKE